MHHQKVKERRLAGQHIISIIKKIGIRAISLKTYEELNEFYAIKNERKLRCR